MLDALTQDVRYALRGMRAKPGFTAAVVLTLGLGLGANAAMFETVDRLLLRPPAYLTTPDRVQRVYLVRTFGGKENFGAEFQYTRYQDLAQWTASFDVTAAATDEETAVGVGDDARQMRVEAVSASFWRLFDAQPSAGRFFGAAEDAAPRGANVVVLSHAFWQSRYGGQNVLQQTIKIAKTDYTIIGVAPAGFVGTAERRPPVAWVPITTWGADEFGTNRGDPTNWYAKYNIGWVQMFARRKPGVTAERATADLTAAYLRSYEKQREMSPATTLASITHPRAVLASVLTARGPNASPVSKVATWVSGVAFIVLLIAAANVANLLLARVLRRRREVALRLALGVTRRRLVSQLLTESLLLSAFGAGVGLLFAQLGGRILEAQFLANADHVSVLRDGRTLLVAGLATVAVGILTGLAPIVQSGRGDLTTALRAGAREGTYHRSRTRVALLVLQGALSVVLLVGAGLFVRSLGNVTGLRMGYDIDRLLWVDVEERGEVLTDAAKSDLRYRLRDAAKVLPMAENAARAATVPFYIGWDQDIRVAGMDTATLNGMGPWEIQAASPEILGTMGTRLLRGRPLETQDRKGAPPVVVISDAMAKAVWPGQDALGHCIRLGADTAPCETVVGITENVRADDEFAHDKMMYIYRSIDQASATSGGLFVRVRGDAAGSAEAVRKALQPFMPGAAYVTVRPMSEIFGPTIKSWRLGATMFVAFGVLALILAAVGLYSVIAYNVAQRTHELGVRVALGAQVGDVVRLVVSEGLRLAIAGVAIGTAIALLAARWVKPLLFNESATDPWVILSVVGVLLTVATLASLAPAWRAGSLDPNVALRSD